MKTSDVLVLFTIIAAIVAVISERNRTYVWLKLSRSEKFLLLFGTIYMHYLIAFDWFYENWSVGEKFYYKYSAWPTPEAWAYILCVCMLTYYVWKLFWGFYPESNLKKVIDNYTSLILKSEFAFLIDTIEKYHLKDIVTFLRLKRGIAIDPSPFEWEQRYDEAYKKVIISTRNKYAANVYGRIVTNEAFIDAVTLANPVFFAEIITELTNQEVRNPDFVNRYLKQLMKNKNGWFFREIKQNHNINENQTYALNKDRPILFALFNNINVAHQNEVWRSIGEEALLEMHEESRKEVSLLRLPDRELDGDTMWSYRIQIAIHFFDIMVRQAIANGMSHHMWMYYYEYFVDAIIKNMNQLPDANSEINKYSRNYKLLEQIFNNLMDWKKVALTTNKGSLINAIYDVTGRCMYSLTSTDKLRPEDKNALIDWLWMDLLDTWHEDREVLTDTILTRGFDAFLHPSGLMQSPQYAIENERYKDAIEYMWDRRDQPRFNGIIEDRGTQFEQQVIDTLLQ